MPEISIEEINHFSKTSYEFAKAVYAGLIAYAIIALSGHYIIGYPARQSHETGLIISGITFFIALYIISKKIEASYELQA